MQMNFIDKFFEEPDQNENESDLEELLLTELYKANIQATDWTTDTIINQIEKGRIQLNPNFQRRDAWTTARKSKFIESVFLGFPIPQLVLAEMTGQKGKYIVIDGKQRLLSLIQFAGSKTLQESFGTLIIKNLDILKEFNGLSGEEIRAISSRSLNWEEFENRPIRTIVIRHWENEDVLYHIFLRLNTESVQLSPQELRNALHPGDFAEFLDAYSSNSKGLRKILQNDKPDFRMRDAELLLRYYAFKNFLPQYSGSIKQFLDIATQRLNKLWETAEQEIRSQAIEFEKGVEIVYDVFGNNAFRKWKDGSFAGRFNRAIFDIMMIHFSKPELEKQITENKEKVLSAFVELSKTSTDFVSSVETTTKSLGATATRLGLWTETLNNIIGTNLPIPTLVNNRIQL